MKQLKYIAASSRIALPICVILAVGFVSFFYFFENSAGRGEPFAWFDGTSAWPSIAIILFAAFLSIHFVAKTHFGLSQNAAKLEKEFSLNSNTTMKEKACFFGWEIPRLKLGITDASAGFAGCEVATEERIDMETLWRRYLCRGRFWMRMLRAAPMTVLYIFALSNILPLIGRFPSAPIRGDFPFFALMTFTISVFLLLTFFVIDAILLHEGFVTQLEKHETYWPDATFKNFKYSIKTERPKNESDLADYWDILLISKRTEAVGGLIYYPFVILSLLIVARLNYFDNWTWSPVLVAALSLHFSLALYAAWRLPKVARHYRDKVNPCTCSASAGVADRPVPMAQIGSYATTISSTSFPATPSKPLRICLPNTSSTRPLSLS
jgi:hypothetical protein